MTVPRTSFGRQRLRRSLRALPAGAHVVLCDVAPAFRGRSRRLASASGVAIEREYVAIPSLRRPLFILQDAPASARYFWTQVATVPPGVARYAGLMSAIVRLIALLAPWGLIGRIVPGRVTMGRRA
jgi:hypothetical protein